MQKVMGEMLKIQRELHIVLRDKSTNEEEMHKAIENMKNLSESAQDPSELSSTKRDIVTFENLNEKYKGQVEYLRNKMAEYNIELKEIESKGRETQRIKHDYSMSDDKANGFSRLISPKNPATVRAEHITLNASLIGGEKAKPADNKEITFAETLAKVF